MWDDGEYYKGTIIHYFGTTQKYKARGGRHKHNTTSAPPSRIGTQSIITQSSPNR